MEMISWISLCFFTTGTCYIFQTSNLSLISYFSLLVPSSSVDEGADGLFLEEEYCMLIDLRELSDTMDFCD